MIAKLLGMELKIVAETPEESDWIREMGRKRVFTFHCSSTGAPPNWIKLSPSMAWDYSEMCVTLRRLHAQVLAAMNGIASFYDRSTQEDGIK